MSFTDIRPQIVPMTFAQAMSDVQVVRWIDGNEPAQDTLVCGVTVSSDDCDNGWIFVAIPGLVKHGAHFAPAAIAAGAVAVVTDEAGAEQLAAEGCTVPVAVVENPRQASSLCAGRVYGFPAQRLRTLAVTGTNGKTTTSYLMRAALQAKYPTPLVSGTVETVLDTFRFPSQRTTAESPVIQRLLAYAVEHDMGGAVVETSSHALLLNRVDSIQFDVVGFTNLQHDHLDFHQTMEEYLEAKALLFTPAHSKRGVVCVDDQWGQKLAKTAQVPVVTLAALTDTPADWYVTDIYPNKESGCITFVLHSPDSHEYPIAMPILGEVNVQNTALAIVCAAELGLPIEDVIASIERAEQIPGRMQKVNPEPHPNQPLIIVDYAHTPEAMEWTLRSTRELTPGRLLVVFGTDGDRDASKREDLAEIAAREADVLWVTDENPRTEDPQSIRNQLMRGISRVRPDFTEVTEVKSCRRDAVRLAILAAQGGDTVIITGKGAEWYQDIGGIKHVYNDSDVSLEVLAQDPRRKG